MEKIIRVLPGGSIAEAQHRARALSGATVIVAPGIYRESLSLDARDSGTSFIGYGATLTGGLSVKYSETEALCGDIRARLSPEAAEKIRMIDLASYGYSREDWGDMYAYGFASTHEKYDGAKSGVNLEVFSGGRRMHPARYPNEGYLKLDGVLDCGDVREFPPQNYWKGWDERRNHRGGTYIVDRETNERIRRWKDPSTAWLFGYLYWDWADSATPITVDTDNRAIMPAYVSLFSARAGAEYYLFNILEELDAPGEYYLDRESGRLYLYPYAEGEELEISLSAQSLIHSAGADGVTVEGFALKCARSCGIELSGNDCLLKNLHIRNVAEHAITVTGYRNTVEGCEITRTGRGGIYVEGGDRESLTPGENRVINNRIHHFSELYQTYQAGVSLGGVGNICAHNEICFTPHAAIIYRGNDHLIEYNHIHDAVLYSADAGAIYAGRDWSAYGTVIRYNLLRDIGSEKLRPEGIYWDDALSGQTAYGNIILRAGHFGFLIGGGRDNVVRHNIIAESGTAAITFDSRTYDGFFLGGWYRAAVETEGEGQWLSLLNVPYRTGIWAEKYPALAAVTTDFSAKDDPSFAVYPANSRIENNIIIQPSGKGLNISSVSRTYSHIGENPCFESAEAAGFDMALLKFSLPPEDFPEIPVEDIGPIKT
ncbi:MAG: right-handed parallel beta-helix repeat-containing protein [Clostridia bacterium]|nr:right-handed parallel beta-helix repeat-containing protein [Clostridia bacterium]